MGKAPPNRESKQASGLGSTGDTSDLASLLRQIQNVLVTEDASFKGLASAAGLDPKRDFRGIYLNGVPLAEQDLRGFDFSNSDLRNTGVERARHDGSTIFDSAVFDGPSLDPSIIAFNRRLKGMPFTAIEPELATAISSGQRKFDVVSLTTAIGKAPNLDRAVHWYDRMKEIGVTPNVFTFSALINKSANEERAAHWYAEMREAGVAPNVTTFNTLINK